VILHEENVLLTDHSRQALTLFVVTILLGAVNLLFHLRKKRHRTSLILLHASVAVSGVVTLVLVFTVFGWFYPARIIRAKVFSLREKEFIEAALMTGASDARIIRSHLLPHLVAPIIVYSTLIVASFILSEAALSFLGVGIKVPTASWGNLLADAPNFYTTVPLLMLWPGIAVVLTTLAFNLLGDGLRDAFDPRSRL